jgi:hypothetical protein
MKYATTIRIAPSTPPASAATTSVHVPDVTVRCVAANAPRKNPYSPSTNRKSR